MKSASTGWCSRPPRRRPTIGTEIRRLHIIVQLITAAPQKNKQQNRLKHSVQPPASEERAGQRMPWLAPDTSKAAMLANASMLRCSHKRFKNCCQAKRKYKLNRKLNYRLPASRQIAHVPRTARKRLKLAFAFNISGVNDGQWAQYGKN